MIRLWPQIVIEDALIGVKSSARLFGTRTYQALIVFCGLAAVLNARRSG